MRSIDNAFGLRFRSLRKGTDMTQEQFLSVFNKKYNRAFTASAISQYENGKRIPEIDALVDFAFILLFYCSVNCFVNIKKAPPDYYSGGAL